MAASRRRHALARFPLIVLGAALMTPVRCATEELVCTSEATSGRVNRLVANRFKRTLVRTTVVKFTKDKIELHRIESIGLANFGSATDNSTEGGRALNRRVVPTLFRPTE